MNKPEKMNQLQVLSPWSEIDPVPLQAPAARLDSLDGKKIGLFANHKRADISLDLYVGTEVNVPEMWTSGKDKFAKWIDDMDGVVLAVGD